MNVDSIRDGIVIDHIAAGNGMKLYRLLGLEELDVPVAMITRRGRFERSSGSRRSAVSNSSRRRARRPTPFSYCGKSS